GFGPERQRLLRSLDLRYRGQAFELNVPASTDTSLAAIEDEFHRRHQGAYGHARRDGAIELVNARLTAYGVVEKPAATPYESPARELAEALVERRPAWFDGSAHEAPVWERERLPEHARIDGPAIVEEFGAPTVA